MSEHTPTPWKIGTPKVEWSVNPEKSYGSSSTFSIVAKGRADPICIMVQSDKHGYLGSGDAQLDANAALLLEAVNSHAANLARIAVLTTLLSEAVDSGLIYWEPQTSRGAANKADMLARIDAAIRSTPS